MEVNPLVFETSASTYSAIWANLFLISAAKVELFFVYTKCFGILFCEKTLFLLLCLLYQVFCQKE